MFLLKCLNYLHIVLIFFMTAMCSTLMEQYFYIFIL